MEINGYRSLTDALNGSHHMAASEPATRCSGQSTTNGHGAGHRYPRDGRTDPDGDPGDVVDVRLKRGRDDYRSVTFRRRSSSRGRRPSGVARRKIQRNIVGERVLGCPRSQSHRLGELSDTHSPGAVPPPDRHSHDRIAVAVVTPPLLVHSARSPSPDAREAAPVRTGAASALQRVRMNSVGQLTG